MMDLVSFIVPVYNVEEYLPQCVDSILTQTYTNIEVLLIDDGSTDRSGTICDEYALADNRVKVIHCKNQGVSSARNTGISLAEGKYIAFVDSDDYIEASMYERLMYLLDKHGADVCLTNRAYRNDCIETAKISVVVYDKEAAMKKLLSFNTTTSDSVPNNVWGGVFNATIIKQLLFDDKVHHYEDFLMMAEIIDKSEKIVITNEAFYHYRVREGSANHVNYNSKTASCLLIADILKDKKVLVNEKDYNNIRSFFISQCYFHLIRSSSVSFDLTYSLKREIKDGIKTIVTSDVIKLSWKLCVLLWPIATIINKRIVSRLLK